MPLVPPPPPKPSGGRAGFLVIVVIVLLIAAAGFYTIWRIVKRAKCAVPDKSNCGDESASDGYPKLPMCTDPDGTATCELQTKVCGDKPDCTGSLSCDYKSQKWTCSGNGTTPSSTKYCTISNGKVNYPIFLNGKDTGSNTVTSNAIQYILNSYPGGNYGCVLSQCETDYVVTNGACVKNGTTSCPNPEYPIKSWATGPKGCYVSECDNTGVGQYTIAKDAQSCTLSSCNPGTTGAKYTPNGDICQPDCSDNATLNYFLTGSATTTDPKTKQPIMYFKGGLDTTKTKCVPDNKGDIWGGCGSTDNPSFYLDTTTPDKCTQSVLTEFARFDDGTGTGDSQPGSSAGCLLCQPKLCVPGNKTCYGDDLCGYSSIVQGNGTPQDAISYCVSQKTGYTFLGYQASGMKDRGNDTAGNPAVPSVGNITFRLFGGSGNSLTVEYNGEWANYPMQGQEYLIPTTYQYSATSGTILLSSSGGGPSTQRALYTPVLWNYMIAQASLTGYSMDVTIRIDTGQEGWHCVLPRGLTSKNGAVNVEIMSLPYVVSQGGGC